MLFTPGYWSIYAFPLLAFVGLATWRKRDEDLARDTVMLKRRRANKIALKRLELARKLMEQNKKSDFYEEISKAIWLYLSDKVNIPLAALSKESATEAMIQGNVPEAIRRNLDDVIWECETALYASGGSRQLSQTFDSAVKVISDLEDSVKA